MQFCIVHCRKCGCNCIQTKVSWPMKCRGIRLFCIKCNSRDDQRCSTWTVFAQVWLETTCQFPQTTFFWPKFRHIDNCCNLNCFLSNAVPRMTSVAQPGQRLRKPGLKQPANSYRLHFLRPKCRHVDDTFVWKQPLTKLRCSVIILEISSDYILVRKIQSEGRWWRCWIARIDSAEVRCQMSGARCI